MGVVIVLVLIGLGACFISSIAFKADAKSKEKTRNLLNSLRDERFEKLKAICIEKGIDIPAKDILESENIFLTAYNGSRTHTLHYIWEDGKRLIFCDYDLNQGERAFSDNMLTIPFDEILFYTKDGNVSYSNKIINEGKNISVSGAIVGGLIAGDAGAIIGAGKDANKIQNVTVTHDEVHTFIYYNVGNDCVKIADVKGQKFYTYVLQLLPHKEYNYVKNLNSDTTVSDSESVKEALKKLKDLYDNGLIDDSEYKTKKEELLSKI